MEYNSTTVTVHIHKKQVCSSLATGRQADSVVGGGGGSQSDPESPKSQWNCKR